MEYDVKGDYFFGAYHQSETEDEKVIKYSPADTSSHLWSTNVDYSHTEKAIESSKKGFETWRKTELSERITLLRKYEKIVTGRRSEIARAIALETGKPFWESETEANALGPKVDVTIIESLKRIQNQSIKQIIPKIDGHVYFKPLGPSLVIGPFNFPCHLPNTQIISALLTGNSIIFKPSEKTILSSSLMFDCFVEAGFPEGVLNLINGTVKTPSEICQHKDVKGIFFTGSYGVGQQILKNTYHDLSKMVALEMGGKNTTIIHHDTNLDHALPELVRSCFLSSGQRCTSTSTILVHRKIADEFIAKFKEVTQKIIVDHPINYEKLPFMGPLIDEQSMKTYMNYCAEGIAAGASYILEPTQLDLPHKGFYVSPSIHFMDKFDISNPITQEEIFGPNCSVSIYDDIDEAIMKTNCTPYGLAAAVFTRDSSIYKQCVRDIDAGIFNLNRSTVGASSKLPFGGVKNSGNYKPAALNMIDHTVWQMASLETLDDTSSTIDSVKGLRE